MSPAPTLGGCRDRSGRAPRLKTSTTSTPTSELTPLDALDPLSALNPLNPNNPVTLASLTLSGPASYVVNASGSLFPSGITAPQSCGGVFLVDIDGFGNNVSNNEAGATLDAAAQYEVGTYSTTSLIVVGSATQQTSAQFSKKVSSSAVGTPH